MNESENFKGENVSQLFRDYVLSGTSGGSLTFLDECDELSQDNVCLSVRINASELPPGREVAYCDFLKAFLQHGKVMTREAIITGTNEQYNQFLEEGCSNAFASGVKFIKE